MNKNANSVHRGLLRQTNANQKSLCGNNKQKFKIYFNDEEEAEMVINTADHDLVILKFSDQDQLLNAPEISLVPKREITSI